MMQVTCGTELAVMFVDTLVKGKIPYDDDTLGQFHPFEGYVFSQLMILLYIDILEL